MRGGTRSPAVRDAGVVRVRVVREVAAENNISSVRANSDKPCTGPRPARAAPPGETHMIGWSCTPRPHAKRRCGTHLGRARRHRRRFRAPARCRSETGVPSRSRRSTQTATTPPAALRAAVPVRRPSPGGLAGVACRYFWGASVVISSVTAKRSNQLRRRSCTRRKFVGGRLRLCQPSVSRTIAVGIFRILSAR